jgi:lysyl-tRNA synthetase class II
VLIESETASFIKALDSLRETIDPACTIAGTADLNVNLFLYRRITLIRDYCDTMTKMLNRNDPAIADRIIKHMQEQEAQSLVHDGYKFEPGTKDYITVNKEDKPTMIAWMKQHEAGKELVEETVAPATLTKFMVETFIEKGDTPPTFVKHFPKPNLRVTKTRG